jgi:hypothetical protein
MLTEHVVLESRTLRSGMSARTDALDKVKVLRLLPDGLHVTIRMVAAYYEVSEKVINQLAHRHRDELIENGMVVLRGADLRTFVNDTLSLTDSGYPQVRHQLAVLPRRTVLNIGMLLHDSPVASQIRAYLLDAEHSAASGGFPQVNAQVADLARQLRRHAEAIETLDRLNRGHSQVICALAARMLDLRRDVDEVLTQLSLQR